MCASAAWENVQCMGTFQRVFGIDTLMNEVLRELIAHNLHPFMHTCCEFQLQGGLVYLPDECPLKLVPFNPSVMYCLCVTSTGCTHLAAFSSQVILKSWLGLSKPGTPRRSPIIQRSCRKYESDHIDCTYILQTIARTLPCAFVVTSVAISATSVTVPFLSSQHKT